MDAIQPRIGAADYWPTRSPLMLEMTEAATDPARRHPRSLC